MAASEGRGGRSLADLLERLWRGYVEITPQVRRIHALLRERGEHFRNDHIALRSFDLEPIGLAALAEPFLRRGYTEIDVYRFPEKRLFARAFAPPEPDLPRVFLSELETRHFSAPFREEVARIVASLDAGARGEALLTREPSWPPVAFASYERLRAESEYAAWVAAFGIRANHFTVHANDLGSFSGLAELNGFLETQGFRLNGSGSSGEKIQGGPEVLLEQSSTLADRVAWRFAGGEVHEIPSCYYEFARRYPDPASGELYQGFVARSADRIFESTDTRSHPG